MVARYFQLFSAVVFTLASILLPATVRAQTSGAEIRGKIVDESAGVLPGVLITVTNLESGAVVTAVTAEEGRYRIPALRPGVYEFRAELAGFASIVHSRLELVIGQIAELDLTMKISTLHETVTVNSEAPLIETSKSGVSNVITKEQVSALPVLGRAWQELALLTPGAAPPTGSRGAFTAGGTLGRDPNVQIDGTDSNDDSTGSSGLQYSQEAIREFNVLTNRFSAEYGRTQSAAVNVVTKSGSNRFSGTMFGFFRDQRLDSDDFFTGTSAPYKYYQVGGSIGGPIRHDRTHFFVVGERQFESQMSGANTGYAELDVQMERKNKVPIASMRLDHVFNQNHQGFVRGAWSEIHNNGVGSGRTTWENAAGRNQVGYSAVFAENWVINSRMVNEFRLQVNRWFTGTVENSASPEYNFPSAILGTGWRNPQGRIEKRIQVRNDLSMSMGNHALKVGVDAFPRVTWDAFIYQNYFGRFFFRTDPPSFTDQSTWPQPYLFRQTFGSQTAAGDLWIFNAYFQDDWKPTDRLTLNLGIRYDVAPGAASEDWGIEGNSYYPTYPTDKDNFGPRFGAAYAVGADKNIVLRGGVGVYQDMFLFGQGIYKRLYNGVAAYTIEVRNPRLSDPLLGQNPEVLRSLLQPGEIQVPDPEVDTPYSTQISGGVALQLPGQIGLTADVVSVRAKNQYRWRDINLFEDCQNVVAGCSRPDPRYTRILRYETRAESEYTALLVGLNRRFSHSLGFQISYTLSKSMNEADDAGSIADPPSDMFTPRADWGPALNDQRHLLVTSATVSLPYQFQVAGIFTAGSGLPFKNLAGYDVNGDGSVAQDRLPGWSRNQSRSASVAKLDTRFSRVFTLVGSAKVEAMLEFYNLFNRRNYSSASYGTVVGARNFGLPGPTTASFYQPRRGQVAFRVSF